MGGQVLVECVTIQVTVRHGCSPASESLEGITAVQQEVHGPNRVGPISLQRLTVDRHRRNALSVGLRRVVGVAHIRGQIELEHRTGVLRVQVALPLLFERVLEVRSLEGHVAEFVGEGFDLVGLRIGDGAVLVRHEVFAQASRVDHADVDALSVRGKDRLTQGVGHQVTEGGLDTAVRARLGQPVGGREDTAHEGCRVSGSDDALAGLLRVGLGLINDCLGVGVRAALGDLGGRDEDRVGTRDLARRGINRQADQTEVIRVGAGRDTRQARVR